MKIRTIHHLSATGGTLISHGIASMPNVYLLSELNPLAVGPVRFSPLDPLGLFGAQYGLVSDADYGTQFLKRLEPVVDEIERRGGELVIRDHCHSDWLLSVCRGSSALLDILRNSYETVPIVTLRHPIEAYVSLTLRGWHEEVGAFDAYCARVLEFLDYFDGTPTFHYEDFVVKPSEVLRQMCQALELRFDADWQTRFRQVSLTGDSGRGSTQPIQPLPVKQIPASLQSDIRNSMHFAALSERVGYATDINELIEQRHKDMVAGGLISAEMQSLIETLRESLQHKEDQMSSARDTIDTMRQSLSWRITKPLRTIRALFRNH